MCDVINIRLKRRIAMRIGKGNQLLNIKTAMERPILNLGLPNFRWGFYFTLLLVASLLFRRIIMTSHMTLSNASADCPYQLYWFVGLSTIRSYRVALPLISI